MENTTAQLRILISGGGIAGNALAFWLSKLGHDVTIIEWFPSLRDNGLQIDLRGHGIEVLRRMGLEEGFRARAVQEEGMGLVDGAGRQWAFFPANKSGNGPQNFTSDFEIMRGDLCRLLHDAAKDRVKYIFGSSVQSFEQNNGAVDVHFSDGRNDRFDLLVGADGQGSRTRRMMLGPGAMDPVEFLGVYGAYFTIPKPIQEGERYAAVGYIAPGRRMVLTRRHSPHLMQGSISCKPDSERMKNCRRGDVKEEKEALAEIFQGAKWKTEWLIKSMREADDFYCERFGLIKMDCWSSGHVTLLGDAAYCPTAFTGMGTTSAMVGAYVLAGEIGKHCGRAGERCTKDGIDTALKAYEEKLRPFMDHVQKGISKDNTWNTLPANQLGITIFYFVMAVLSFLRIDPSRFMIREDIEGWSLPDYDDMVKS